MKRNLYRGGSLVSVCLPEAHAPSPTSSKLHRFQVKIFLLMHDHPPTPRTLIKAHTSENPHAIASTAVRRRVNHTPKKEFVHPRFRPNLLILILIPGRRGLEGC